MYEPKDNVAYAYRAYPKWVYKDGDGIIVNDSDEHDAAKEKGYGAFADNKKSVDVEKVVRTKTPKKPTKKAK